MSYYRKIEYKIIPEESYPVWRGCPGCGKKTHYRSTEKFRVNANGNKLDVWLIYQCEKCRHTLNLSIYERQGALSIPGDKYMLFLDNDRQLAREYGRDIQLFRRNKAEVDFEGLRYRLEILRDEMEAAEEEGARLRLLAHNPYGLKIRPERQIAELLGVSGNQAKRMLREGEIELEKIAESWHR